MSRHYFGHRSKSDNRKSLARLATAGSFNRLVAEILHIAEPLEPRLLFSDVSSIPTAVNSSSFQTEAVIPVATQIAILPETSGSLPTVTALVNESDSRTKTQFFTDGSFQQIHYVIGETFTLTCEPTGKAGDQFDYSITQIQGTLTFAATATDSENGDSLTVNDTFNYGPLSPSGSTSLVYSTSLHQVLAFDFNLPSSGSVQPTHLNYGAYSGGFETTATILLPSEWQFDNMYFATQGTVTLQVPSVSGTVFNDSNGNGTRDSGESGQTGVTVFGDFSGTGQLTSIDPQTTTDASGNYQLDLPWPMTWLVREVIPTGGTITKPAAGFYSLSLTPGQSLTGEDFGNKSNHLAFAQQPINSVTGGAIAPAVTVNVEDPNGNVLTNDNSNVTLSIVGPTGANLGGTTTVAAINGVATFTDLLPSIAGTYTLKASDGLFVTATSVSFYVDPNVLNVITHGFGNGFIPGFLDKFNALQTMLNSDPPPVTAPVGWTVETYKPIWQSSAGWIDAAVATVAEVIAKAIGNTEAAAKYDADRQAGMLVAYANAMGAANMIDAEITTPSDPFYVDPSLTWRANDPVSINLIGHSRGAAVNALVANMLAKQGYYIAEYAALDGYSIDWPKPSNLLADIPIVPNILAASASIGTVINYQVQQGLASLLLDWVGERVEEDFPALAFTTFATAEILNDLGLDWMAPPRPSPFQNLTISAPLFEDLSNHLNVTPYFTSSAVYRQVGQYFIVESTDAPAPSAVTALSATSLASPAVAAANSPPPAPDNFTDGSFSEESAILQSFAGSGSIIADDPSITQFLSDVESPAEVLQSIWQTNGSVQFVTQNQTTLVQLSGFGSSIGQPLTFDGSQKNITFNMTVNSETAGSIIEAIWNGAVVGQLSLDGLTNLGIAQYSIPISSAASGSGLLSLQLAGPQNSQAVVNLTALAVAGGVTWTGNAHDSKWSTPGNWSDNLVPTEQDAATIPSGFSTILVGPGIYAMGSVTSSSPVEITAGSLLLSSQSTFNDGLTIDSAATVHVVDGPAALVISGLSIITGGTLDLTDNDMIIHNGALTQITSLIEKGFAGPGINGWTGTGITSSAAAAVNDAALGVVLNNDGTPQHNPLFTTFDGQSVINTDVFVKYTYYGDAQLKGDVEASDYLLIDNALNYNKANPLTPKTGWVNGDFNYDGVINGDDYTLIDNAFNSQDAVGQLGAPADRISPDAPTISSKQSASTSMPLAVNFSNETVATSLGGDWDISAPLPLWEDDIIDSTLDLPR